MYIYGVCMLLILENNTFVGLDCTRFPYMSIVFQGFTATC